MEAMVNLFSLAGRTAVITGGTRGIGAVMAIALAEAGADIILVQVGSPGRKSERLGTKTKLG
jgi:2-deoxy-D-gluconate 3-dehydrogenase